MSSWIDLEGMARNATIGFTKGFNDAWMRKMPPPINDLWAALKDFNCDEVSNAPQMVDACVTYLENLDEGVTLSKVDEKITKLRLFNEQCANDTLEEKTIEEAKKVASDLVKESIGMQELLDTELTKLQGIVTELLDDLETRVEGLLDEQIEEFKEHQLDKSLPKEFKEALEMVEALAKKENVSFPGTLELQQSLRKFLTFYDSNQNTHKKVLENDRQILNDFASASADGVNMAQINEVLRVMREVKTEWQSLSDVFGSFIDHFMKEVFPNTLADAETQFRNMVNKQLPEEVRKAAEVAARLKKKIEKNKPVSEELKADFRREINAFLTFHANLPETDVDRLSVEKIRILTAWVGINNFSQDLLPSISQVTSLLEHQKERRENSLAAPLDDLEKRVGEMLRNQLAEFKEHQLDKALPAEFKAVYEGIREMANTDLVSLEQFQTFQAALTAFLTFYGSNQNTHRDVLDEHELTRMRIFSTANQVTRDQINDVLEIMQGVKIEWQSLSDVMGTFTDNFMRETFPHVLANAEDQFKDVANKQLPEQVKEAVHILWLLKTKIRKGRTITDELKVEAREKLGAFLVFHGQLPETDIDRLTDEQLATIQLVIGTDDLPTIAEQVNAAYALLRHQQERRENILSSLIRSVRENSIAETKAFLRPYFPEIDDEDFSLESLPDLAQKYLPIIQNKCWSVYSSILISYIEKSDLGDAEKAEAIDNLNRAIAAYNDGNREGANQLFENLPAVLLFGYRIPLADPMRPYPDNVNELQALEQQIRAQAPPPALQVTAEQARTEFLHIAHLFLVHLFSSSLLFGGHQLESFTACIAPTRNLPAAQRQALFFSLIRQRAIDQGIYGYKFRIGFALVKLVSGWLHRVADRSAIPLMDCIIGFAEKIDVIVKGMATALNEHNRAWKDAKETESNQALLPDDHVKNALRGRAVSRGGYTSNQIHKMSIKKVLSKLQVFDLAGSVSRWEQASRRFRILHFVILRPCLAMIWVVAKTVDKVSSAVLRFIAAQAVHRMNLIEALIESVGGEEFLVTLHALILDQLDEAIRAMHMAAAPFEGKKADPKKVRTLLEQFVKTVEIYNGVKEHAGWQRLKGFLPVGTALDAAAEPLAEALGGVKQMLKKGQPLDATLSALFTSAKSALTAPTAPAAEPPEFWKALDDRLSILIEKPGVRLRERVALEAAKTGAQRGAKILHAAATNENVARTLLNQLLFRFATT